MSLFSREHYELLSQFEREFKHSRLDKETKDLWPKGVVFQDGHVNELFLAYRKGHAFGKHEAQQPAGDVARDAAALRFVVTHDDWAICKWGTFGTEKGFYPTTLEDLYAALASSARKGE